MAGPLAGLRVVATVPPHSWFGGVDFNFAVEMIEDLRGLGATVLELDTGGFVVQNEHYIATAIESIRSFRPDVAFSLPNAGYALICRTADQKNVFRDILRVPTIMLWDHGLLQFPKLCLDPLPQDPSQSRMGSLNALRKMLVHPLFHHYSPDRGHIAALDRLGIISRNEVHFFLQPAYPNFVRHGYREPPTNAFRTHLAFAGNVYIQATEDLPFHNDAALLQIERRVLAAKQQRLTECLWDLLLTEIRGMPGADRNRLSLTPDSTYFWRFIHDEIEVSGNTAVRLHVLNSLSHEFDFYGNFIEPAATSVLRSRYNITFRKSLDYFTELPLLFMNSDIIVDVINLGYNSGISPKVIGCLACGGFVLFDYKKDFHEALGDIACEIMYRDTNHLNALIDCYLANPRRRRDVSRYLQYHVLNQYSFGALCRRIFSEEPVWRN